MPTKKLYCENLLNFPSLNRDGDNNGVASGWDFFNPSTVDCESFLDESLSVQAISVLSATDIGYPAVYQSGISVTEGQSYTLSAFIMSEGTFVDGSTGPRVNIKWFDGSGNYLGNSVGSTVNHADFTRNTVTGVAPAGAATADIYLEVSCDPGTKGTVWFKNAQFQKGEEATEYEENDFFAARSTNNTWAFADGDPVEGRVLHIPDQDTETNWLFPDAGTETLAELIFKFTVPEDAQNIRALLRVNADDVDGHPGITIQLYHHQEQYSFLADGTWQNVEIPINSRGYQEIKLVYIENRANQTEPARPPQFIFGGVEVSWDEAEPEPEPVLPTKKKVHYLSFDPNETGHFIYDPFFNVITNFPYSFEPRYEHRHSGFYSLGVAFDEDESYPRIPDGETAVAEIRFKVPVTAIEPGLFFWALYDAEEGQDTGSITLNGETLWSASAHPDGGPEWVRISTPLIPGMEYVLRMEYTKDAGGWAGTDSIYIDDVIISFDIPDLPYMVINEASSTEIKTTESATIEEQEGFENPWYNKFFNVVERDITISSRGNNPWPEFPWKREPLRGSADGDWNGKPTTSGYMMMSDNLGSYRTSDSDDGIFSISFTVPQGAKNAFIEFWQIVETLRSIYPPGTEKYPRLYDEYRIWVNGSIWKEFNYCSPDLTGSVSYTDSIDDGNHGYASNDYACPWGKWWKERLELKPGSYKIAFEFQSYPGSWTDARNGRNFMAVDDIKVSWEETHGEVLIHPPRELIRLDGTSGIDLLYGRTGAEAPNISFASHKSLGRPGEVYQYTNIDSFEITLPLRIRAKGPDELLARERNFRETLLNRPLALEIRYPEGENRFLNCHYSNGLQGAETEAQTDGERWRKMTASFRAFDPYWYGPIRTYDGDDVQLDNQINRTWVRITNDGDADVWPVVKIFGPAGGDTADDFIWIYLTAPDEDTGKPVDGESQLWLEGYNLPADRYIVVDMRPNQRRIILDDGTPLYEYLNINGSKFFSIPKGDWGLDFDFTGGDENTKLAVQFQIPFWGR